MVLTLLLQLTMLIQAFHKATIRLLLQQGDSRQQQKQQQLEQQHQ